MREYRISKEALDANRNDDLRPSTCHKGKMLSRRMSTFLSSLCVKALLEKEEKLN